MKLFRKERTDFKKPISRITDKHEIVDYAKIYLKKTGSLIDMNGFIHSEMNYPDADTSFIRDVAYLMWGTGKYDFADTYKKDEYLLCKKQSWIEKHPYLHALLLTLLSALISLIVTKVSHTPNSMQLQLKKDTVQDSTLLQQRKEYWNSLNILQSRIKTLEDSLKR